MNEHSKKRMEYMEGYNLAFMNWWSYGEYFFDWSFRAMTYHPNLNHLYGYRAAYDWIIENLGPVRHLGHRTMLWPRPYAAEACFKALMADLRQLEGASK